MNKVSIVIPVYNEASYIADCLQSIQDQTVLPFEVIVVDNNSTDDTAQIARSFPFVRVVTEPQQGIVYARNAGFNAAQGDIIGRIDADTQLHESWVENVTDIAGKLSSSTACTGPASFREWHGKIFLFWLHRVIYFWSSYVFLGHRTLFGSNMFITKKQWHQIRGQVCVRTDIHEDMDLSVHVRRSGGSIHFDQHLLVSISPRRIARMGHYPAMWAKTKFVHPLLLPRLKD